MKQLRGAIRTVTLIMPDLWIRPGNPQPPKMRIDDEVINKLTRAEYPDDCCGQATSQIRSDHITNVVERRAEETIEAYLKQERNSRSKRWLWRGTQPVKVATRKLAIKN
jgi:hypothetical protein